MLFLDVTYKSLQWNETRLVLYAFQCHSKMVDIYQCHSTKGMFKLDSVMSYIQLILKRLLGLGCMTC